MDGVIENVRSDVTQQQDVIASIRGGGPIVTLPPGPKFRAYYLIDEQLEELANSGNSYHLSFSSIAIGVFFTTMMTIQSVDLYVIHPKFYTVCVVLTVASGFVSVMSGLLWFRSLKRAKDILIKIRSQYQD